MEKNIYNIIEKAIDKLRSEGVFEFDRIRDFEVSRINDERFGDYMTNVAMIIASKKKKNPREIAQKIVDELNNNLDERVGKIEVAGSGFINFRLTNKYWQDSVSVINEQKDNYGSNNKGNGKKVLIEFVSANPTGPVHLGNARGGPYGDVLANIFEKNGWEAHREYYVNDAGNQVNVLGHSVLKDEEAQYKGEYIDELHKSIKGDNPYEVGKEAAEIVLDEIIKPTFEEKLGIKFDKWFSEKKELHDTGKVDEVIEKFKKLEYTYEKDGALWFRSTEFGDDKDRVMVKKDGSKTYFIVDVAYHINKIERGFDKLIDVWGADHWGDVPRMQAAFEIVGFKDKVEFVITQFVRVMENGKEVKMSKRRGTYIIMDDLIEEVGKDVTRFIFLMYSNNAHVNFDLNVAREKSEKNPVYYVQYAHARVSSIINKFNEEIGEAEKSDLSLLIHEKELSLMKELGKFPELIGNIIEFEFAKTGFIKNYDVHSLPHYAMNLADKFHSFYNDCRVIDEDNIELSKARVELVKATQVVLKETFRLMGISAPEKM